MPKTMNLLKLYITMTLMLLISACASLPENNQQKPSYAWENTQDTTLANSVKQRKKSLAIAEQQSGLLLLDSGLDAFVARVALVRLAQRSLDVQYYLYHNDLSGGLLTAEIWRAAERGVRVRMLLDDMDMSGRDQDLAVLNAHEHIEIRIFNPFIRGKGRAGQFVTRMGSVTRRMHNKALISDNQVAIIGGRNVGDEYFDANPNMAFGDLDVAMTRPAAGEVSTQFDMYWNNKLSYPVETLIDHQVTDKELADVEQRIADFQASNQDNAYLTRLAESQIIERARAGETDYHWGDVTILYDDPLKTSSDREKTQYHMAPKLKPYIESVDRELIVISPYFVPGKDGVKFFTSLRQRGVKVKILTNSLTSNDVAIVHAGYAKYRKKLLKAGVELYEIDKTLFDDNWQRDKSTKKRSGVSGSKASLHAKYFVLDRELAFIGSLNLDPRSVVENTEIGAIIHAEDLAQLLGRDFDENIKKIAFQLALEDGDIIWQRKMPDGEIKTFKQEPYSTWWDRFSVGFMKWLPAESQL